MAGLPAADSAGVLVAYWPQESERLEQASKRRSETSATESRLRRSREPSMR
jgi:hypothetical protein